MATTEGERPRVSVNTPTTSGDGDPRWRGRRIKRFKLIEELGRGAMGRVFVAEDTVLSRHVALKLLPTKHRDGRAHERTARLIAEARSAASLDHPNVVTIYEIDECDGMHYIAMELVEGGNLEKLVQLSGPMEIERACQLIADAAEALAHAHSRGIVHRDVKPANLLLTRNGRCKVADFGLAMIDSPTDGTNRARCVGTPHFVAPEMAIGHGGSERSDIYSLGCTLWFLLSGRPPFSGVDAREILKQHVLAKLPDLRLWRGDVPDRLVQVIEQACAKKPQDRFQSAERFAKTLRTFTITTGSSSSLLQPAQVAQATVSASGAMPMIAPSRPAETPETAVAAAPAARKPLVVLPRKVIVAAASIVIATGALAGYLLWSQRPGPQAASAKQPAPSSAAISAAAVVPLAEPNAAINPTMDRLDVHGGLAGWFIHDRFKSAITVPSEEGNRFLRLTNDDANKTVFADQRIAIDPSWKALTISAQMRATNFKSGKSAFQDARVAFAFRDADDKRVGDWPPVPSLKGDSPWTTRVATVDVPRGAASLYVQLAIFNATGTVDFDDVKVIPQRGR